MTVSFVSGSTFFSTQILKFGSIYSLYSTATQNYWRWGFVSGQPPMPKFASVIPTCWYLRMLKFSLPLTRNIKFVCNPNATPQCKPMEYRLRCVTNAKGWRWPCTFHVVCAHFIPVGYPTPTEFTVEYGLECFPILTLQILQIVTALPPGV